MPGQLRLIAALIAIATVLSSACRQEATPPAADSDPARSYNAVTVDSLGLSLEYPEGWIVHEAFSGLTLASSQEVIDEASLADIDDEAFVNIIPGELAVFNMQSGQQFSADQPAEVLAHYQALLENEGQTFVVRRAPEIQTINGQNVARMTVESDVDGERLVSIMSVILNEEFMAFVSAGALRDHFEAIEPVLLHVLDTIVVTPPTE